MAKWSKEGFDTLFNGDLTHYDERYRYMAAHITLSQVEKIAETLYK